MVHVVDGVPQTVFAKAAYTMATSDAERIGVNAAANVTPSGGASESALSQHCSSLRSALQMLSERVQIIHAFCLEMQQGKTPVDHQVRRSKACWWPPLAIRCVHRIVQKFVRGSATKFSPQGSLGGLRLQLEVLVCLYIACVFRDVLHLVLAS